MRARVLLIVAAAAWGCKSSTSPGSVSCSVTLSGSLTGTYDCVPYVTAWASSSNTGSFSFLVDSSGTRPRILVNVGWSGAPTPKTYSVSDAGANSFLNVTSTAGPIWLASAAGGTTSGSYTLSLTSVTNAVMTASGDAYTAHGTLVASLAAITQTGATGTVGLHVTF